MSMTPTTWILALESQGAHVFAKTGAHPIELIKSIEHPEGRGQDVDFNADRPGRSYGIGGGRQHSLKSEVAPHEAANKKFVHQITDFLSKNHEENRFARLILVAPPHLLGLLRKTLSPTLEKIVTQEITKEIPFNMPEAEAIEYLNSQLA